MLLSDSDWLTICTGCLQSAAGLFEAAGKLDKAAALYLKAGSWEEARRLANLSGSTDLHLSLAADLQGTGGALAVFLPSMLILLPWFEHFVASHFLESPGPSATCSACSLRSTKRHNLRGQSHHLAITFDCSDFALPIFQG